VPSLRRDPDELYAAVREDIETLTKRLDLLTDARPDDDQLAEIDIIAASLHSLWTDFDEMCRRGDYPRPWKR
jgi:hypothetical protein